MPFFDFFDSNRGGVMKAFPNQYRFFVQVGLGWVWPVGNKSIQVFCTDNGASDLPGQVWGVYFGWVEGHSQERLQIVVSNLASDGTIVVALSGETFTCWLNQGILYQANFFDRCSNTQTKIKSVAEACLNLPAYSYHQLSYLNLSNAYFSGVIPPHIGNLSNLKVLDLRSSTYSYNRLVSDDMSWMSGLSSLEYLDLSKIDLSKAQNRDMVFYLMPSLVKLSLSGCSLTNADLGTLSYSSTTLANIKHLDLGYNHFKGQFPGLFQNMTSLEFLDLSYFNFSLSLNSTNFLSTIHYFPKMRLSSCGLHNMHLSPNHLNFTTISIIQHLDLSQNLLEGGFPSALTNMSSLLYLDLASNMLNSSVPIMPNLLRFDLSRNNFEHIEDVGIWRQCHLKELTVSDNYFKCSQYAFKRLHLDGSLKGAFPADTLGRMVNLRVLRLSDNELTGQIPESLGRLRLLEELDLSHNQLRSHSDIHWKLVSLQMFSVDLNSLNGTVPVSIGQLAKLKYLDISENSLEGVITEAHFANLSMLKYLFTSFNSVSLEYTTTFQYVINMDLSSNNLVGEIPVELMSLSALLGLNLSNNHLNGSISYSIGNMKALTSLDFSRNQLTSPIPPSIATFNF
ncbi:leucine-rich repeat protein [Artemisia annua]|uniref:Leucine-rich repeat protein n=1 Tax=Artemisia annua TaxID=35608 RepID=A0A2U1M210_ARTAN|nr:leucine-rich repeat protein [Artemisia annua]